MTHIDEYTCITSTRDEAVEFATRLFTVLAKEIALTAALSDRPFVITVNGDEAAGKSLFFDAPEIVFPIPFQDNSPQTKDLPVIDAKGNAKNFRIIEKSLRANPLIDKKALGASDPRLFIRLTRCNLGMIDRIPSHTHDLEQFLDTMDRVYTTPAFNGAIQKHSYHLADSPLRHGNLVIVSNHTFDKTSFNIEVKAPRGTENGNWYREFTINNISPQLVAMANFVPFLASRQETTRDVRQMMTFDTLS